MGGFFREGLWIPLLLLSAGGIYALWFVYRGLDRFRRKSRGADEELKGLLLAYQAADRQVQRAAALIEDGELDRAIEQLREIQLAPVKIASADFFLAKAFLAREEKTQAREHLQKFIAGSRPDSPTLRHLIEEARRSLDMLPKA